MTARLAVAVLCFTVSASVVRVLDGDTFVALAPVWHGTTVTETVRVLGVDTPEMTGVTKPAGEAAKAFTAAWLAAGPVTVVTCKRDSFGRALGNVSRGGVSLAEALVQAGHGVRR